MRKNEINIKDLYNLCNASFSLNKIANKLGCSKFTIQRRIKEFNISYKDKRFKNGQDRCLDCNREIGYCKHLRCRKCDSLLRLGAGNYNYKGGITKIYDAIRRLKLNDEWREKVFERDNYTCQDCGDNTGGNLNAHHKKQFSIILSEFLEEYNQFSQFEEVAILTRLAMKYKSFWDIENGKTLCKDCHIVKHLKEER